MEINQSSVLVYNSNVESSCKGSKSGTIGLLGASLIFFYLQGENEAETIHMPIYVMGRSMASRKTVNLGIVFGIALIIVFKNIGRNQNAFHAGRIEWKKYERYVSYPDEVPLLLRCPTCAYVAGSGHLLGSKKGSEIDSMDCVIRSNDSPTDGFEVDVGNKTTIRTLSLASIKTIWKTGEELSEHDGSPGKPSPILLLIVYPIKNIMKEFEKAKKRFPHLRLFTTTTQTLQDVSSTFQNRVSATVGIWMSSGYITLYIAHEICDVIHVYGVNDENFCKHVLAKDPGYADVPYHYYGSLSKLKNCNVFSAHDKLKTDAHAYTKEKILFGQFAKEWGNLYFHAPEWATNTHD